MKSEWERRADLIVGDPVWVLHSTLIDNKFKSSWVLGTIDAEPEPDEFDIRIVGAPDMPTVLGHRWWSPNVRPLSLLELVAEAAQ